MSSLTHPSTPSPFNLFLLLLLLWSHWGFCFPTLSGEGLLRTPWDVFQLPLSCWVWRRPHRPETLLAPAVTPFSDASTRHWRQEQSSPDISLCVTDSSVFHFRALFLFQFFYIVGKKKKKNFWNCQTSWCHPSRSYMGTFTCKYDLLISQNLYWKPTDGQNLPYLSAAYHQQVSPLQVLWLQLQDNFIPVKPTKLLIFSIRKQITGEQALSASFK